MRLLPLLPGAFSSIWTLEVPQSERREAQQAILERDGHRCRFCGHRATGGHAIVRLIREGEPGERVTACPLCETVLRFRQVCSDRELSVIWLPEMSQAALNSVIRAIHLTFHEMGEAVWLGSVPRHDSPTVRVAYRAYAALANRTEAAERRIGTSSPTELAAALAGLRTDAPAWHHDLPGALRLLHRGRRFRAGEDIYPEIVAAWSRDAASGLSWESSR